MRRSLAAGCISMFLALVEHYQVVAHYLRAKAFVFVLVFPVAGTYAAFDKYQAAFVQVFLGQFGKPAPQYYGVPFCL